MLCPKCGQVVDADVWFCPLCAHQIVDAVRPAAGQLEVSPEPTSTDEVSSTMAWADSDSSGAEALIVGALTPSGGALSTGAVVADPEGRPSSVLLYAEAQAISPDVVPLRTGLEPEGPTTPYETFLLEMIDGRRTVAELQRAGLLAWGELVASLLTLVERDLVRVAGAGDTEMVDGLPAALVEELRQKLGEAGAAPATRLRTWPTADEPPLLDPSLLQEEAPPARPGPHPDPKAREPRFAPPQPLQRMEKKARELYQAALKDREAHNLVSARMNLKLAIAFDPGPAEYRELFAALGSERAASEAAPRPDHPQAAKLYAEATQAEAAGRVDEAVELLERALKHSKEAILYNRLGVILSMKKKEIARARELLDRAVALAPENPIYVNNLCKLAALAEGARVAGRKQGFFARWFSRRRS